MRIGISTLMIQRGRTGIAQYLFALLRGLAKLGAAHELTLFVLEEDIELFGFVRPSMKVIVVDERHRPPINSILWHQLCLPGLVRRHDLQVLHVPSYRRLLARHPCALVATIHDLAPFRVSGKYDWKRMFYGRVIARWLAKRQDQIIAVSHNTAKDIALFFGISAPRVRVVLNGIDHQRFFPGDRDEAGAWVAKRYGINKPFFLYVARLEHPGKNHVRLISAFEQFRASKGPEWQLVFGGSDWHGAEVIHAAIRRSAHQNDIRSLGFVPDNELPQLYLAASAFVYPSLYEGFGMPPLEAMACGCPVLSSTSGALREVVGSAALSIDAQDTSQMAKQLARVASDPELRKRLSADGIDQARCFDWDRTAAETLKVYEQSAISCGAPGFVRGSATAMRY